MLEIDKAVYDMTVKIEGTKEGTGFYITENIILTAYHVIKNEQETKSKVKIIVDVEGANTLEGDIIDYNKELDIALIKVEGKTKIDTIPISIRNINENEDWRCYTCFPPYELDDSNEVNINVFEKKLIKGKIYQNEEFIDQVYDINLGNEYLSNLIHIGTLEGCSGSALIINNAIVGIIIKEERSTRDTALKAASFKKFKEFFDKNKIQYNKMNLNTKNILQLATSTEIVRRLEELPSINLLYDEYENTTNIILPSNLASRETLVTDIINDFNNYDVLNIYGPILSGKTILSELISRKINKYKLYIDLENINISVNNYINDILKKILINNSCYDESEDIVEQICKLLHINGILILDNFMNLRRGDKVYNYISKLLNTCKKYNMKVIIISNKNINHLNLNSINIKLLIQNSENLSKEDISQMLNSYSIKYNNAHIDFIYGITKGHPSLVDSLLFYLKQIKWNVNDNLENIFNKKYTEELQVDLQYKIMGLIQKEDSKELLYRIALIDFSYDIELVKKIAEINPTIFYVNEKLIELEGWINKDQDKYSNTILLSEISDKNLNNPTKINVHKAIVKQIFDTVKHLDYIHFQRVFIHLNKAQEFDEAGLLLCKILLNLEESGLDNDPWNVLSLWKDTELPDKMSIEVKLYLCIRKILCCKKLRINTDDLFITLDKYIEEIIKSTDTKLLHLLLLLLVPFSSIDTKTTLKYYSRIVSYLKEDIFKEYNQQIKVEEELKHEHILFLCSVYLKTQDEVDLLFNIYENMNSNQRNNFNSLCDEDLYECSSIIFTKMWFKETLKEENERNFENILRKLKEYENSKLCYENKWFYINNIKSQIIVYGEYLKDIEKAELIAKEIINNNDFKELSIKFIINYIIGKQFYISGDNDKAISYFNNLSMEFEGMTLEKIDYLNEYSIINSMHDNHQLAIENLKEAMDLIKKANLTYEEELKNLGEISIEYWLQEDYVNMYKSVKQFISISGKFKPEDNNKIWMQLNVCLGHFMGYISSILSRGKPPEKGSNGIDEYSKPIRGMFIKDYTNLEEFYEPNKNVLIYFYMGSIAESLKIYEDAKYYYRNFIDKYNLDNGFKGIVEARLSTYSLVDKNYDEAFNLVISQAMHINSDINNLETEETKIYYMKTSILNYFVIPLMFEILNKFVKQDLSYKDDSLRLIEYLKKQSFIGLDDLFIIENLINENLINDKYIVLNIPKSNEIYSSLKSIEYICLLKLEFDRNLKRAIDIQFSFMEFIKNLYKDNTYLFDNIVKSALLDFWTFGYCKYRDRFKNTEEIDEKLGGIYKDKNNIEINKVLALINIGLS